MKNLKDLVTCSMFLLVVFLVSGCTSSQDSDEIIKVLNEIKQSTDELEKRITDLEVHPPPPPPPPPPPLPPPIREIAMHLEDAMVVFTSIKEAFRAPDLDDVAEHAAEIVLLAQEMRKSAIDLEGAFYRLVTRDIRDIQHSAHELEDAAEARDHDEAHHAADNLDTALQALREDLQSFE